MGLTILIADPQEIHRLGLRTIFEEDPRVSSIYEVATEGDLHTQLCLKRFDLVIVNQSIMTDLSVLPRERFVILVAEPDVEILKSVYQYGARGYLSTNTSAEILRAMLRPVEHSFLIDPTFVPSLVENICGYTDRPNNIKNLLERKQ